MKEQYSLLSPEKVYLNLNLAGVGSRFAAVFIDGIFQGLLVLFFAYAITPAGGAGMNIINAEGPSTWWGIVIILIIYFVLFYFF
ncbi:MAG: hypothetical protein FH758_14560 [Firmicutes bacterium]|nr:hypothetical protein [Bacillota bacterium]